MASEPPSNEPQGERTSFEVCDICCKHIEDATDESEGHDALFCEGECQCWLHRWCAGVSRKKFQQLTGSAEPFLCPACVSQKQQAVIEGLQGNIQALTAEVLELKATVERFRQGTSAAERTDGLEDKESSGASRGKLPWNIVAGSGKRDKRGNSRATVPKGISPSTGPVITQGTEGPKTPRVRVSGARKIWGTLKSTTTTAVANVLKVHAKVPSNSLSIKRKYKTARNNSKQVVRWWFVVRGEEKLLEQLQSDWSSVSIQTAWKLEPVLEFLKSPPASLPMPTLTVAQSGPDQAGPISGAAVGSQSQTETGPEVNGSLAHSLNNSQVAEQSPSHDAPLVSGSPQ